MHRSLFLTLAAVATLSVRSEAATVYSDNFDSGHSLGSASAYYSDASQNNGLVVKSEEIYGGPGIASDVSGSGHFLFNGTSTLTTPAGQMAFYDSQTFAVAQNGAYTVSFYLTNDNTTNVAQVVAQINGVDLGTTVSALGSYQTNGWQQFSFTFNSLNATSETLTLLNLQTNWNGNDFGVDNIVVAGPPVPEPSSLALMGIAGAVSLAVACVRRIRSTTPQH
jgi:hypothetical protein